MSIIQQSRMNFIAKFDGKSIQLDECGTQTEYAARAKIGINCLQKLAARLFLLLRIARIFHERRYFDQTSKATKEKLLKFETSPTVPTKATATKQSTITAAQHIPLQRT
jgi:hypothetical protein